MPVIWATQVLEHLVQKGTPLRGEMTDAAMAARAECVMLNKGPYLLEAIDQLTLVLGRMDANQHKKTPQLRRIIHLQQLCRNHHGQSPFLIQHKRGGDDEGNPRIG